MIHFRQFYEPETSTLTYLLADPVSKDAVLIDPVLARLDDYLGVLAELDLELHWVLDTHVHADHVTAAGALREATGAKTAVSSESGSDCVDVPLEDEDTLIFGNELIRVIATPGHTPCSMSFLWRDRLFTGDALLIGGCGRTDFQGGDARALYHSIHDRLFTLPAETLVYPGHDYQGRRVSCIAQESASNPRLAGKSEAEFVAIMAALDLPPPRHIAEAVPANRACGQPDARQVQGG